MGREHELVGPHAGRGDLILPEGAHHALAGAWYAHDLAMVCRDELRFTTPEQVKTQARRFFIEEAR